MLKTAPIRAYIPVSDVSRARKFYEGTIGLVPKQEYAGGKHAAGARIRVG